MRTTLPVLLWTVTFLVSGAEVSKLLRVTDQCGDLAILNSIMNEIPPHELEICIAEGAPCCWRLSENPIMVTKSGGECNSTSAKILLILSQKGNFISIRLSVESKTIFEFEFARGDRLPLKSIIRHSVKHSNFGEFASSPNDDSAPSSAARSAFSSIGMMTSLIVGLLVGSFVVYGDAKRQEKRLLALRLKEARCDDGKYVGNSVVLRQRKPRSSDLEIPISPNEFKKSMDGLTEFMVDYLDNNRKYPVTTDLKPDWLLKQLPPTPPTNPDAFSDVMRDVNNMIIPFMTHWHHPRFHAYFNGGCNFANILSETLIASLSAVGTSWECCPSLTELEVLMTNWVGRALGLPESFLYTDNDSESASGGGSITASSSDSIFLALLAARYRKIQQLMDPESIDEKNQTEREAAILGRLVAYASDDAHSCIVKAANMGMVQIRIIPCDRNFSMRGAALEAQVKKDIAAGLIPFHLHATSGTTSITAFDKLDELGPIAKKYGMWFHIDAAYGGAALICPEFRYLLKGMELADSLNFSGHKLMHATSQGFIWARDQRLFKGAFTTRSSFLNDDNCEAMHLKDFGISSSRRLASLKTWFLFRLYGIQGLQAHFRRTVACATLFRERASKDERLDIPGDQRVGLAGFRLKADSLELSNLLTDRLCDYINKSRKIFVTHANPGGVDIIRLSFGPERTTLADIEENWQIIKSLIDEFLENDEEFDQIEALWAKSSESKGKTNYMRYRHHLPLSDSPQ